MSFSGIVLRRKITFIGSCVNMIKKILSKPIPIDEILAQIHRRIPLIAHNGGMAKDSQLPIQLYSSCISHFVETLMKTVKRVKLILLFDQLQDSHISTRTRTMLQKSKTIRLRQ